MKTKSIVSEDIKGGYAPEEITFRGYTTVNLHHSTDAVKAFQDTISRFGEKYPNLVLSALQATDRYMKLNDMHLEQGLELDSDELQQWIKAHNLARHYLNQIGDFMHHYAYWHSHEQELQGIMSTVDMESELQDHYDPTEVLSFTQYLHLTEAEYQGKDVKLNKPMPGDVKKSKVYVKGPSGRVVKVNFGDKNMTIKKHIPERKKSFRARHNCDDPGPKHKARYWSCKAW